MRANSRVNLNPFFVTGYTDGEGSFSVRIKAKKDSRFGYGIVPVYSLGAEANPYNKALLENLKAFFNGVGSISTCNNMYYYEVSSLKTLQVVRQHFLNYPLETSKSIHFLLWCQVIDLIEKKAHHTYDGFLQILAIKSVFPKGLSDALIKAFPGVQPIVKPEFVPKTSPLSPH
jgi:hypothetical protein